MTISALSERVADSLVRDLRGEAYPAHPAAVAVGSPDNASARDHAPTAQQ